MEGGSRGGVGMDPPVLVSLMSPAAHRLLLAASGGKQKL